MFNILVIILQCAEICTMMAKSLVIQLEPLGVSRGDVLGSYPPSPIINIELSKRKREKKYIYIYIYVR